MKILLIEDNPATAKTIKHVLKDAAASAPVDVRVAQTLKEGLQAKKAIEPNIVLLDLILPDADGWRETASHIPELGESVIVLTDLPDPNNEIRNECMLEQGAKDFLPKGVALRVVVLLVSAITSEHLRRNARV